MTVKNCNTKSKKQPPKLRHHKATGQAYGNGPGTNIKGSHQRQPGKHYTPTGLGHAVAKAIKKAFRPEGMSDEKFAKWKPSQHWHPHQLRHNAATYLRKEFGLETARIISGPSYGGDHGSLRRNGSAEGDGGDCESGIKEVVAEKFDYSIIIIASSKQRQSIYWNRDMGVIRRKPQRSC